MAQENCILFNANLLNFPCEIVKLHKPPQPKDEITERAAELRFKVIRLPPNHCQYSP